MSLLKYFIEDCGCGKYKNEEPTEEPTELEEISTTSAVPAVTTPINVNKKPAIRKERYGNSEN
jgi:hypothetical protein